MNLNVGTRGIQLADYQSNSQWDILSTSASETNTYEASVTFILRLSRKPSFYIINVILPVVLLSLLNCCTFILPIASGERAGYSITVFLSLAVFLTIVASELPKNSDRTSLLAIYLMCMTSLSTIIVIISLIEIRLSCRTEEENTISKAFLFLYKAQQVLQCKTCNKPRTTSVVQIHNGKPEVRTEKLNGEKITNNPADVSDDGEKVTWMKIVNAIDFAAFCLCTLTTFLCTVILMTLAARNQ